MTSSCMVGFGRIKFLLNKQLEFCHVDKNFFLFVQGPGRGAGSPINGCQELVHPVQAPQGAYPGPTVLRMRQACQSILLVWSQLLVSRFDSRSYRYACVHSTDCV